MLNVRGSYTGIDSYSDKLRSSENLSKLEQTYDTYLIESAKLPLTDVNSQIATDMRLLYLNCKNSIDS